MPCHRAYDAGELDLLPYLEPGWRAQVAHAVGHVGLIGALRRISGNGRDAEPRSTTMIDAVKQVIATDKDGAKLSPEQLADAGVKPGDRAVIEIRPYTKRDFERDDVDRVYDTVEGFTDSLEDYCELPDGEQ